MHLALTDAAHHRFLAVSDQSRGACDLAGAVAEPFRVWVGNNAMSGWAPSRLTASTVDPHGFSLALSLQPGTPPVLQGDAGLSQKGAGSASYYYSLPRMPTTGTITINGLTVPVAGSSWMDREWSTSALSADEVGWDWFALQLADGRELMLYRMRRADGGVDPASSGTLIDAQGHAEHLDWSQVRLSTQGTWTSPRGGTYPASWHLVVPGRSIDCHVQGVLADQELAVGVRYWEGAVDASGPSPGRGYVELTGYAEPIPGR